jgi:uncharacterized protein YbjT (DUF2867 family)
MNRALIIGATGNVGRQVVSQLAATDTPVRALVRNPDTAHLPAEVEVVRGDLALPESLDACLEGVEAVFLVWTAPPATVELALERIARRTRRLVFLSSPYKTPHPFFQAGQPNPIAAMQAQIESVIQASGLQWTFLRPGMIAANARYWWGPQIRAGDVVRWPYLAAATAPIDERDIAAVAIRALTEDGHAGMEYVLTGPQSLTQAEQVSTIGHAIGRSLRVEEMPLEEARREWFPDMLLKAWAAAIGQPAYITSIVEEVTGAPARTFLDWALANVTFFRAGHPST